MLKKYKLWWLICAGLFYFISFNWVSFGLTGLTLIRPVNETQFFAQAVTWVITAIFTMGFADEGEKHE
jgi:uncharacterized membrane protein YbhN (UPF0104 family)